ncbi:MAG: hypothetical protein K2X00_10510 [Nitrospiraceae bacterium]|jgi:hypothetical protein|nr:hypothetical protein [Nitrospiraceae bacterium]
MTKIGVSLSLVAFVWMMMASTLPAQLQNAETRLSAKMISGVASGKADYRARGNRKRLNVEAEDLPGTTPAALGVFVNASAQVGTMALAVCPAAPTLLCGELELNTQDGQAVPTLKAGDIISIGTAATSAILSGALR